jgi:hypothetical protein
MTEHRTRDLRLASYIWAQSIVPASFEGLVPIPQKENLFYFNFKLDGTQDQVDALLSDYKNNRALVEPNRYNEKMGQLRDDLSAVTGGSRR